MKSSCSVCGNQNSSLKKAIEKAVAKALSANNEKWAEKIEEYYGHYDAMYFTDWKKIQSQMKE